MSHPLYIDQVEALWPHSWSLRDKCHASFLAGSVGFGLNNASSDRDLVYVVIPPSENVVGLDTFDSWHHQTPELDLRVYSLRKFVSMLVKANPNILDLTFLNAKFRSNTAFGRFLLDRSKIVSQQAVRTLLNACSSIGPSNPEGKTRKDLAKEFGYDTKAACHSFRWLLLAREILKEGENATSTTTGNTQEMLLDIKSGLYTHEDFVNVFSVFRTIVEEEFSTYILPKQVDRNFFNDQLVKTLGIFV